MPAAAARRSRRAWPLQRRRSLVGAAPSTTKPVPSLSQAIGSVLWPTAVFTGSTGGFGWDPRKTGGRLCSEDRPFEIEKARVSGP
jgi:hypothetical protein